MFSGSLRLFAAGMLLVSQLALGDVDIEPRNALLSDYPYPYPVQQFPLQVQQQSLTMAYMDIPPSKSQKPRGTVLLLHGKNFSGAYWKDTIDALVALGCRVIVPDQIGFGKSSKPAPFQYSFHGLAASTKALLDKLDVGSRFSILGKGGVTPILSVNKTVTI